MRTLVHMLLIAALACGLSACGNKGKLRSPTQIQSDEAKKAKKKAKQAQDKAAQSDDATQQTPPDDTATPPDAETK